MKKLILFLLVFSLLSIGSVAFAKNSKKYAPPSDEATVSGVYDVEGQPDLKVKVFVYKEKGFDKNEAKPQKPPKPGDGSGPSLVCGLLGDDLPSDAEIGSAGWYLRPTVNYYLNVDSVPSSVGGSNLTTIVNNSFEVWENALESSAPSINEISTTNKNRAALDGQNIISWGRNSGKTLGVTYVWYTNSGDVVEVDTIMNKSVTWGWSADPNCAYSNAYDAQNIMTHELGHWFGLDDEYTSPFVNNTMYGYGSKVEVKKNTLTNGDIAGVRSLYY